LSNSITGTAVFYAGGGGGTVHDTGTPGTGGNGGGGNGGQNGVQNGTNGTANTGGGGGGSPTSPAGKSVGNNGGSGVVILRYPTGYILGGITGSTITSGGYDITTFTSGTGTITFN
jgi:hypothetical protein